MNIIKYISVAVIALSLASCSTRQESIINDYNELIEDAEQLCNSDFDEYTFMRISTEHEGLLDEINNGDIEFNKQQQQELDRLEKKFIKLNTRLTAKQIGQRMQNAIENVGNAVDGFLEGLNNNE